MSLLEFKLVSPLETMSLRKAVEEALVSSAEPAENTLTDLNESYIRKNIVYQISMGDEIIGFYALHFLDAQACFEISQLWIKPLHVNKGFGTAVFKKIVEQLRELGQHKALIRASSLVSGFYEKMGGKFTRSEMDDELSPIQCEFTLSGV